MNTRANLERYLRGRSCDARYSSFDYCFNYFQSFRSSGQISELATREHLQLSCLHLGFYLASWGMFRGSSNLLKRSARYLAPTVEAIANADAYLWRLDVPRYSDSNIDRLLELGEQIRRAGNGISDILVTKVMLGVFGNVPALDRNFKKGFTKKYGGAAFNVATLRNIRDFYEDHAELIELYRVPTLGFVTGKPTNRRYTRAKAIDMAFFIEGMSK